jgi:hypothetical protein
VSELGMESTLTLDIDKQRQSILTTQETGKERMLTLTDDYNDRPPMAKKKKKMKKKVKL